MCFIIYLLHNCIFLLENLQLRFPQSYISLSKKEDEPKMGCGGLWPDVRGGGGEAMQFLPAASAAACNAYQTHNKHP